MCQEPDLNWWHEDFQSSALPAELSRPFTTHHPHFNRWLGSMSIKKTKRGVQSLIQALVVFLSSSKKKEDFVSFSTVRAIIWSFQFTIGVTCSMMFICTCIVYIKRLVKRKKLMNEKHNEFWTANEMRV